MDQAARQAAGELESIAADEVVVEPRRRPWVWLVYGLLYAVAIPWYWPSGYRGPLVLGLPLWVLVSLTAVFCLALWTVRVLATTWVERSEGDDGGDRGTTS